MTVARITQNTVEVVSDATPKARLTQMTVEVVSNATPKVRLSQLVIEVVSSTATVAPPIVPRMNVIAG